VLKIGPFAAATPQPQPQPTARTGTVYEKDQQQSSWKILPREYTPQFIP